ncbi:MAG: hypothetical protein HRU20_06890 [Pseudomonadales bacterium]|nr:hypothetical protein [Pseudomonadales bacterium]
MLRITAAIWGFTGVAVFLAYAVYNLLQHTIVALDNPMTVVQWGLLLLNIIFMAYSEGYKGFQKSFSPRVAARVLYLSRHANILQTIFAPIFCLGYFGTTRRRQISVFILTGALMLLVAVVKGLDQPWRGIIDAGVVVGLSWGLIAFIVFVIQAFTQPDFAYSAEINDVKQ